MKKLFEEIKIGKVKIKNRIAMSPMNAALSTQDGYVTNDNIGWHARRAKGGFGLIITDAIICTKLAAPFVWGRNLYLYNDSYIAGLNRLVEAVHNYDAKIFAQLSIGFGRQGHAIDHQQPYAPSSIPYEPTADSVPKTWSQFIGNPLTEFMSKGEIPRVMTIEEIKSEIIEFGDAVQRAIQVGFDGIEIHAPHGYLEHQFLSPRSNQRTDMYGGSLENRMRFIIEVCKETLKRSFHAIPIGIRMSCAEHMPGGFTLDDIKIVAKKIQDLGLDFWDVSDGSYEAAKYFFPENIEHVKNHLLPEVNTLKKELDIPIITPSIHDPVVAEQAVKDGITDMISLGRQAIADPDWPNKVQEGNLDQVKKCTRCMMCLIRAMSGLYIGCQINPNAGFEYYDRSLFPEKRKDPMIPKKMLRILSENNPR